MKRNSDSELEELYAKRKKLDLQIALLEQETLGNGLLEVLIHLVSTGALNILDLLCLSKTNSAIRKRTLNRTIWEHFSDNWLFRHYAEVSDLISPWGFLARLYRITMYTDLDFQRRLTQAVIRTQSNLLLPGTIATRVQSTKDPTYRHLMGYIVGEKNIQFRFIRLGKVYRKYPMHQNFPLADVYSRLHADIYLCCEGQAPVGLFQFLEILDNFLYQYPRYMRPEAWQEPDLSHPHNLILDWWTRLGVLGVVVLIWLEVAFFKAALRLYRSLEDEGMRVLALGLMASMVDFIAHGLVDNSYFLVDLAFIFCLTLGLVRRMEVFERREI